MNTNKRFGRVVSDYPGAGKADAMKAYLAEEHDRTPQWRADMIEVLDRELRALAADPEGFKRWLALESDDSLRDLFGAYQHDRMVVQPEWMGNGTDKVSDKVTD